MLNENLVSTIELQIKKHWNNNCFSDSGDDPITYSEAAEWISSLHDLFRRYEITSSSKIAIVGRNSKNWALVYLATITYGAVIVPLLPDFSPEEYNNLLHHSDAELLFGDPSLLHGIHCSQIENVKAYYSIHDFKPVVLHDETCGKEEIIKSRSFKEPSDFSIARIASDSLATIVYTSGTTGHSKGVMLSHNALMANVKYAMDNMVLNHGDSVLSFLPLSHAFGCAFDFLSPFLIGCHITFVGKIPSPKILLKAFSEVRPHQICTVPLILEKVYKNSIKPVISKKTVNMLIKTPGVRKIIQSKMKNKLMEVFGGRCKEIIVGGAELNSEVVQFFREIGIPFTVGYGMTECGPLISYSGWKEYRNFGVGKIIDYLILKIESSDPANIPGEILVRGENVMKGYYKNKELTSSVIDTDGWLHTGDLGILDKDNVLYLKGRIKNIILGPSGQNIYPEELEDILLSMPYVLETVVIFRENKLTALVFPDHEAMKRNSINNEKLNEIMEKNRQKINKRVSSHSHISKIECMEHEFEKTPTKKIKRNLYT